MLVYVYLKLKQQLFQKLRAYQVINKQNTQLH